MEYNRWSDKNVSFFVVDLISSADCKVKWHCNVFSTKQLIFYAFLTPESGAFQITQRQFIKGPLPKNQWNIGSLAVLIRSKDLSLKLVNNPKTWIMINSYRIYRTCKGFYIV